MPSNKPRIILVNHGLANNYGKYIEINRDLLEDPELYKFILSHELEHSKESASFLDVIHDLNLKNIKMILKMFKFVLKKPKTWIDFLPIQITKGKIIYDKSMISLYIIFFSLLGLFILLLSKIL
ncbi:hypothetical protein LCGC14_0945390 [marine sediment metagenome]|uniref:Uncharacterized protein n=1 Tax=marine sediment metagenome TaxID=412755 RepID=A0A0F9P4Y1_9ZZZZ